jgi:hypothetical protein
MCSRSRKYSRRRLGSPSINHNAVMRYLSHTCIRALHPCWTQTPNTKFFLDTWRDSVDRKDMFPNYLVFDAGTKMSPPPVGHYFLASIFSEGASDAKRWSFFQRNASRTLPFARSYQRVVRNTNFTLESSEVFLWRERRAAVGRLAARAARCRPNLLVRSGQHTRLGLLSRPLRAQSSRRHKVEYLRVQTASERHGKQRRA